MKKLLLSFSFLLTIYGAFAQTYSEKAAEIEKLVWGSAPPEFSVKDVPAKYAGDGAVILAQSYTMQRSSNLKLKFLMLTPTFKKRITKISTLHKRIKINDKSALEAYSGIEYQKRLDNSVRILTLKYKDLHETYIGAKIISPNGKETVINTGEEVMLKNTTTDQKGKLAIAGLQVGDILDYYISHNDLSENDADSYKTNHELFVLADTYPILSYSLSFQFNDKSAVYYISANGAPKFTQSKLENGDKVLALKMTDIPKYESQKWTSVFRQYPYIEISNQKAQINPDFDYVAGLDASKYAFKEYVNSAQREPYSKEPIKLLQKYYEGKKGFKAAPLDSSMRVFYDLWKYLAFGHFDKDQLDDIKLLNYRSAKNNFAAIAMSQLLTEQKISHELLLVASRESNSLANVFQPVDFNTIVKIYNDGKPLYMAFDDVFSRFNEIPSQYQGEQAIRLVPTAKNEKVFEYASDMTIIPAVTSDKNRIEENITVSLLTDMQKISVQRAVKQSGYLRSDDQKSLINAFDVDTKLKDLVKGDPIEKRFKDNLGTKKYNDAFFAGLTKTPEELKKAFMNEAQSQYDQEPLQIVDFKVTNVAMDFNEPTFEFTSTITLNNFVKKAGNSYILYVGRLAGTFVKLEDKERNDRTLDIYMPGARSFKYQININIPTGYQPKGVGDLNCQKINKTGSFSSVASVKGNVLTIVVYRAYNNSFEKATDWPLVTELVDAGFAFNNQKILFEK